jgi:hypothetical protein
MIRVSRVSRKCKRTRRKHLENPRNGVSRWASGRLLSPSGWPWQKVPIHSTVRTLLRTPKSEKIYSQCCPNALENTKVWEDPFTTLSKCSCEYQSPKVLIRSPVRTPEQTPGTSCASVWTLAYSVQTALEINADLSSFGSFYPNLSPTTRFFLRFFIQKPWSMKIQRFDLKFDFRNVIYMLGSTLSPIFLR